MSDHSRTGAMAGPVEVRTIDEAKRLATMLVCRYGERSTRTTPPESFVNGAFTKSVELRADRVPFTDRHTGGTGKLRAPAIARPVAWDVTNPAELVATLRFFDTPDAWAVFIRARDGEIDGGSVGFEAIAERTAADGTREITEAKLHHVMLCATRDGEIPAYDGPRLLEVRTAPPADVAALLAVRYDPAVADNCVSAEDLARMTLES
jgi:hypothetical protein